MKDKRPRELTESDIVGKPVYCRYIASNMRSDGGCGFWLTCDRPFEEAATDLFRDALHACKPVPSVYGNRGRFSKLKRAIATVP